MQHKPERTHAQKQPGNPATRHSDRDSSPNPPYPPKPNPASAPQPASLLRPPSFTETQREKQLRRELAAAMLKSVKSVGARDDEIDREQRRVEVRQEHRRQVEPGGRSAAEDDDEKPGLGEDAVSEEGREEETAEERAMASIVEELEEKLHARSLSQGEYSVARRGLEREGEAQQRRQRQEERQRQEDLHSKHQAHMRHVLERQQRQHRLANPTGRPIPPPLVPHPPGENAEQISWAAMTAAERRAFVERARKSKRVPPKQDGAGLTGVQNDEAREESERRHQEATALSQEQEQEQEKDEM